MDKPTADAATPARPRLTVQPAAAVANWREIAKRAPRAACAAVVKANAYGLGAGVLGPALAAAGCRTFFVAYASEGVALRRVLGAQAEIFVLHGRSDGDTRGFIAHALTPVLVTQADLAWWAPTRLPGALHVDTGMNRLGLGPKDLAAWTGPTALLMSHLVSAEIASDPLNQRQRTAFLEAARAFANTPKSLANSAGVLLGEPYHFDLVRPGIGLYGGEPVPDAPLGLSPVATVSAPILQVRDLAPGETVGYNAAFTAERSMRLATIALGYADGFLRAGAGRGYGVLAGARCPVVGRISMDLITLDVTAAGDDAQLGADVEMLGAHVLLDDVARAANTNSYEVLTRLGGRLRAPAEASA